MKGWGAGDHLGTTLSVNLDVFPGLEELSSTIQEPWQRSSFNADCICRYLKDMV